MRFFGTEIDGSGWSLVFWIFDQNRAGFQEVREPLGGGVRGVSGGSQGGPGGGVPGCSRKGGPQKVFRRVSGGLGRSQGGPRGVPGGSQGGPRGVPGGSQGGPRGVPESVGVPEKDKPKNNNRRQNRCRSPPGPAPAGGVPGICQPGPQTPPGGTPLTPVKNTKRHQWS